jgi:hypothetical protein
MATTREETRPGVDVGDGMTATFKRQMQRLGGLKFAPSDLQTHWEALRDLSDPELVAAVDRAQRECDEFPSPRLLLSFVPRPDMRGHFPPCRSNSECIAKVLGLGRPERVKTAS